MDAGSDYRITTPEALRRRMGHAGKVTPVKLLRELDDPAIDFIRRSPFLVLSTADARGHQEASPKGDDPGFVIVEDRKTLLIPDRKGNKLLFGLLNILANPQVGLLFIVPPNTETLRVNGTAELTVDPQLLERLAARGKPAEIVIRLTVQQCFSIAPRPSSARGYGSMRVGPPGRRSPSANIWRRRWTGMPRWRARSTRRSSRTTERTSECWARRASPPDCGHSARPTGAPPATLPAPNPAAHRRSSAAEGSKATAMLKAVPLTLLLPVAMTRAVGSDSGLPTAPSWGWLGR